jgi:energy-coupling factor transport system permease protein
MRHLTFTGFQSGESVLHRLDPRTKLLCTLALMAALFVVDNIPIILFFWALAASLYPLGHIPLTVFWRHLRSFVWLYAITFSIHLLFDPGAKLLPLPWIGGVISLAGLRAGILFTVRIAALLSLSTLLMILTAPQDMTDGLERLLRPLSRLGVPIMAWALMISIALRFVPVLLDEGEKIRRAQISRGANLEGSWLVRLRKIPPLVIPLFAAALKRADDLAQALEARGYRGGRSRTRMIEMRLAGRDATALGMVFGLVACIWIWR